MAWLDLRADIAAEFEELEADDSLEEAAAEVAFVEKCRESNREAVNDWAERQRIATRQRLTLRCPTCGGAFEFIVGTRGRPQTHCSPRCARVAARREYRSRARDINSQTVRGMSPPLPRPILTPEMVERLRHAVVLEGAAAVARRLGLSRVAVLGVLAGSAHPGTIAMVQRGFSEVTTPGAQMPPIPGKLCA